MEYLLFASVAKFRMTRLKRRRGDELDEALIFFLYRWGEILKTSPTNHLRRSRRATAIRVARPPSVLSDFGNPPWLP